MVTIAELRKQLMEDGISPFSVSPISIGELEDEHGIFREYALYEGWDLVRANQCDKQWGKFNFDLIEFIDKKEYSEAELADINTYIQLDDRHWEWLIKSCQWRTEEYKWFFLYIDNNPQAACVVYHPKTSAAEVERNIYYVEYLAAAPWNRKNPMHPQLFKGVGKVTLKHVQEYCSKELNWNLGFSLHSLPKAESYYKYIGMTAFSNLDKKVTETVTLKYFEMLEEPAKQFVEGA